MFWHFGTFSASDLCTFKADPSRCDSVAFKGTNLIISQHNLKDRAWAKLKNCHEGRQDSQLSSLRGWGEFLNIHCTASVEISIYDFIQNWYNKDILENECSPT